MEKIIPVTLIFLSLVLLVATNGYMKKTEDKINSLLYSEIKKDNSFAVNTRIIGGKKFGADMLFVKQVLDIGGDRDLTADQIKETADAIITLNPYMLVNYTFSGMIVGMIRVFNRIDYGLEIINKGVDYNPDEWVLKYYLAGLIAYSKGNEDELLLEFEKIVEKYNDDMIVNTVSYIYEKKYEKTKELKFLAKAVEYWTRLLTAKDETYRKKAETKLNKYAEDIQK